MKDYMYNYVQKSSDSFVKEIIFLYQLCKYETGIFV